MHDCTILILSEFELQCSLEVYGLGFEIIGSTHRCTSINGVIDEVFCIYDDGSPGAVTETC